MAHPLTRVLHELIDRAGMPSQGFAQELHDAVDAHDGGFASVEEYQADRKAKAEAAAKTPEQRQADEDAVLAQAEKIRAERAAANAPTTPTTAEPASPAPAAATPA